MVLCTCQTHLDTPLAQLRWRGGNIWGVWGGGGEVRGRGVGWRGWIVHTGSYPPFLNSFHPLSLLGRTPDRWCVFKETYSWPDQPTERYLPLIGFLVVPHHSIQCTLLWHGCMLYHTFKLCCEISTMKTWNIRHKDDKDLNKAFKSHPLKPCPNISDTWTIFPKLPPLPWYSKHVWECGCVLGHHP